MSPACEASSLGSITASSRGGALWSQLQGNDLRLGPHPDHRFPMRFLILGILPIRLPSLDTLVLSFPHLGGKDLIVAHLNGNALVLGERITPVAIPDAWARRVGAWRPVNTDGVGDIMQTAHLRLRGEFLVFETQRTGIGVAARPLRFLSDAEALTTGTDRSMGETIRVKDVDGAERLVFSGYELVREAD